MSAHVEAWDRRELTSPWCLLQVLLLPGPVTAIGEQPRAREAPRGGRHEELLSGGSGEFR